MKTLEFPYSEDPKELIVCRDQTQIRQIQKAFRWDAQYTTWFASVCGNRYNRIIIFRPNQFNSQIEKEAFERELHESWLTRLFPKGEVVFIDV